MIPLAVHMSRSVDGVVAVADELTFAVADTHLLRATDLGGYLDMVAARAACSVSSALSAAQGEVAHGLEADP